jgi:hypothetical protein
MNEFEFVDKIQNYFDGQDFYSQRELGVGYGIADLVLVKKESINLKNCETRRKHNQKLPLLSENYFETLRIIPDEESNKDSVDFDYLAKRSSLSKSFLKYKVLPFLESHKYIKQLKNKSYLKVNGWIPLADEIIAIEAKLSDWKRGALQANRYKAFAHKVFLIIPEGKEHNVDKKFFIKHEIGLMVFSPDNGRNKIIIDCPSREPFDSNKFLCALEYFWEKLQ